MLGHDVDRDLYTAIRQVGIEWAMELQFIPALGPLRVPPSSFLRLLMRRDLIAVMMGLITIFGPSGRWLATWAFTADCPSQSRHRLLSVHGF